MMQSRISTLIAVISAIQFSYFQHANPATLCRTKEGCGLESIQNESDTCSTSKILDNWANIYTRLKGHPADPCMPDNNVAAIPTPTSWEMMSWSLDYLRQNCFKLTIVIWMKETHLVAFSAIAANGEYIGRFGTSKECNCPTSPEGTPTVMIPCDSPSSAQAASIYIENPLKITKIDVYFILSPDELQKLGYTASNNKFTLGQSAFIFVAMIQNEAYGRSCKFNQKSQIFYITDKVTMSGMSCDKPAPIPNIPLIDPRNNKTMIIKGVRTNPKELADYLIGLRPNPSSLFSSQGGVHKRYSGSPLLGGSVLRSNPLIGTPAAGTAGARISTPSIISNSSNPITSFRRGDEVTAPSSFESPPITTSNRQGERNLRAKAEENVVPSFGMPNRNPQAPATPPPVIQPTAKDNAATTPMSEKISTAESSKLPFTAIQETLIQPTTAPTLLQSEETDETTKTSESASVPSVNASDTVTSTSASDAETTIEKSVTLPRMRFELRTQPIDTISTSSASSQTSTRSETKALVVSDVTAETNRISLNETSVTNQHEIKYENTTENTTIDTSENAIGALRGHTVSNISESNITTTISKDTPGELERLVTTTLDHGSTLTESSKHGTTQGTLEASSQTSTSTAHEIVSTLSKTTGTNAEKTKDELTTFKPTPIATEQNNTTINDVSVHRNQGALHKNSTTATTENQKTLNPEIIRSSKHENKVPTSQGNESITNLESTSKVKLENVSTSTEKKTSFSQKLMTSTTTENFNSISAQVNLITWLENSTSTVEQNLTNTTSASTGRATQGLSVTTPLMDPISFTSAQITSTKPENGTNNRKEVSQTFPPVSTRTLLKSTTSTITEINSSKAQGQTATTTKATVLTTHLETVSNAAQVNWTSNTPENLNHTTLLAITSENKTNVATTNVNSSPYGNFSTMMETSTRITSAKSNDATMQNPFYQSTTSRYLFYPKDTTSTTPVNLSSITQEGNSKSTVGNNKTRSTLADNTDNITEGISKTEKNLVTTPQLNLVSNSTVSLTTLQENLFLITNENMGSIWNGSMTTSALENMTNSVTNRLTSGNVETAIKTGHTPTPTLKTSVSTTPTQAAINSKQELNKTTIATRPLTVTSVQTLVPTAQMNISIATEGSRVTSTGNSEEDNSTQGSTVSKMEDRNITQGNTATTVGNQSGITQGIHSPTSQTNSSESETFNDTSTAGPVETNTVSTPMSQESPLNVTLSTHSLNSSISEFNVTATTSTTGETQDKTDESNQTLTGTDSSTENSTNKILNSTLPPFEPMSSTSTEHSDTPSRQTVDNTRLGEVTNSTAAASQTFSSSFPEPPALTSKVDELLEEEERLNTRATIQLYVGIQTIKPIIPDPAAVIPFLPEPVFAAYGDTESLQPSAKKSKGLTVAEVYNGCGKKKGCIGSPPACVPYKTCLSLISFAEGEDRIKFQIMGRSGKYVAVGLSKDRKMGDDSVVECVREGENVIRGYISWNLKHKNIRETDQSGISDVSGSYSDGHIMCEFFRKRAIRTHNQTFDLAVGLFHVLHARGNSATDGPNGNIGYHDDGHSWTEDKYYLNDHFSKLTTRLAFEDAHSVLSMTAWLFLLPLSVFIARYFKETYTNRACCFEFTVWFTAHVILTGLALVLTIVGVGLAYTPDPTPGGKIRTRWSFHAKLGIACVCILGFECITGIILVFLNLKTRNKILNYVHGLLGHASMFFAVALMLDTVNFGHGLPCLGKTVLIAYIVVFLIIALIMAYQLCFVDFLRGHHISRAYNIFHVRPIPHLPGEDMLGSGLRKICLGVFTALTLNITLLLVFFYFYLESCSEGEPE